MAFWIITLAIAYLNVYGTAKVAAELTFVGCTESDFADDNSCTLSCTLQADNTKFNSYTWAYYVTNPFVNYTYEEDTSCTYINETNSYQINLTLSEYNSGYYRCQFYVNDSTEGKSEVNLHNFRIATTSGAGINDACQSASQCLAINAFCDNTVNSIVSTCNCHGDYDVPYNNDQNTPACLQPAALSDECQSDNQCLAMTNFTACLSGHCNCAVNYLLSEDGKNCIAVDSDDDDDEDDGLTGGQIAGIVIGCLAGVAIIVGIIVWIVK